MLPAYANLGLAPGQSSCDPAKPSISVIDGFGSKIWDPQWHFGSYVIKEARTNNNINNNKKIKLYLFYKKTKNSFLHLIEISILFVFEQTTLPTQNQHIYVLHCFPELLDAVPPPTHWIFAWQGTDPDHHLLLQPEVRADVAGKGRRQTEINDTKTPKHLIKWDRRDTFHICCWIINRWKQPGIRLNLIKTIPRHSEVTEHEISLKTRNLVSASDWKFALSLRHFSKIKPLLQSTAADSNA